jgi:hypothetical protein
MFNCTYFVDYVHCHPWYCLEVMLGSYTSAGINPNFGVGASRCSPRGVWESGFGLGSRPTHEMAHSPRPPFAPLP